LIPLSRWSCRRSVDIVECGQMISRSGQEGEFVGVTGFV